MCIRPLNENLILSTHFPSSLNKASSGDKESDPRLSRIELLNLGEAVRSLEKKHVSPGEREVIQETVGTMGFDEAKKQEEEKEKGLLNGGPELSGVLEVNGARERSCEGQLGQDCQLGLRGREGDSLGVGPSSNQPDALGKAGPVQAIQEAMEE